MQTKKKEPTKHRALDRSSIYDFVSDDDEVIQNKPGLLKIGSRVVGSSKANNQDEKSNMMQKKVCF